jgi:CRP/FNR family transcriptional regulator, anaerobic regulatory protein
MKQRIAKKLTELVPFSEDELEDISPRFELRVFPKGSFFSTPQDPATCFGIIKKGLLRVYFENEGKEMTAYFVPENGTISSLKRFQQGIFPFEYIQALEEVHLWCIHLDDVQELCTKYHHMERFMRLVDERLIVANFMRVNGLLSLTATERYERLMERFPELFQRVALQYIASYLGIAPESLSRLRKNLMREQKV